MLYAAFQHILITVPQIVPQPLIQITSHNGPHCMDHVLSGQIISLCQDCLTCRFLIAAAVLHPFPGHIMAAGLTQFDSRRAVDGIVDASVTWHEASEHLRICRIDNGSHMQSGDISLPDGKLICIRMAASVLFCRCRYILKLHNPFLFRLFGQEIILHPQDFFIHFPRHTDIHEGAQDSSLLPIVLSRFQISVLHRIFLEFTEQIVKPLFLLSAHAVLFLFIFFVFVFTKPHLFPPLS